MYITPLAVWAHKLSKDELFYAVALLTRLFTSNDEAIEVVYLYCYCLHMLINGATGTEAYNKIRDEAKIRSQKTSISTAYYWMTTEID
jgi:hypothetical protein